MTLLAALVIACDTGVTARGTSPSDVPDQPVEVATQAPVHRETQRQRQAQAHEPRAEAITRR